MISLRRALALASRRPSRRSLVGVTAGVAAVALALTPAGAAVLPTVGGYYIQTNGSAAAIGLGDYYTSTSGGNQDHLLRIHIPCSWPAGKAVHVDLYGAEMTSHSSTYNLSEEPGGSLDTSEFTINGPGAVTATQTFAPTSVAEVWTRFHTIPDGRTACGEWTLTDKLLGSSDDQNGWKLRVGGDNDTDPTNAPPADYDNPDGIAGTDDEIVMGLERTTFQHDAGAVICQTFWSYVEPGLAQAKFHNFDMDNNGRVRYYPPGSTIDPTATTGGVAGTLSQNARWNGSAGTTRAGDVIASPAPGWWAVVSCISNHNQLIQEGVNSGLLYMAQPGTPVIEVGKTDGVSTVSAGDDVTYDVTVRNTSDTQPTPGAATQVVATDTLPSGFTFGSCSWTAPAVGACTESGGVVTATLTGPLNAGATAAFSVEGSWPTSAVAGSKTNTVSVAYEDSYDNTFAPVTAQDTDTLVRPTDVYVTDAFDSPFYAGQPNALTVTVGNEGVVAAADVEVTGTIASGFDVTGFDTPPGWSCSWSAPTFTCALTGTLAVGDEVELRVLGTVTAPPDTDVTAPVEVTTSTVELDTADNDDTTTKTTTAFPADVRVTDAIESTFYAGQPNALVVTVGSEGLDDAADVEVTGPIPAGFEVTGFDAPPAWNCTATADNWTCSRSGEFATGAPDEVIRVLGTVTAAPGDEVEFPVSVATSTLELDLADNDDTVAATAVAFPADVTVTTAIEDSFETGQPNALVVTVGSEGLDDADGVVVGGPLPDGFAFTGFDAPLGWLCSAQTVTDPKSWQCARAGTFATGAPEEVIRVLGDVTAAGGDSVTFSAEVSTTTLELDLDDNTDDVSAVAKALSLTALPVCDRDVPWLQLDVAALGFTPAPDATATVVWRNADGEVVRTDADVPLSDRLLWPGAAIDGDGNPTDWPGWTKVGDTWVTEDDGLLPDLTVEVSVNPTASTTVTYPPATPDCAAAPTIVPVDNGGGDNDGGDDSGGGDSGATGGDDEPAGVQGDTDDSGANPDPNGAQPAASATPAGLAETGVDLGLNLLLALMLLVTGVTLRRVTRPRATGGAGPR